MIKAIDFFYCLEFSQGSFTFGAAFIVFGITQTALFIAAGNYNFAARQMDGSILEMKIAGIQKNGMIFFTHGDGELVHDAAVYTVVIVFRILSD